MPRIKMGSSNHVEMVHSLYREKIFQIFHVEHVGILFFRGKWRSGAGPHVNGRHVERSKSFN